MEEPDSIRISENQGDPDTETKFYSTFKKSSDGWCGQCVISSALGGFSGQLTRMTRTGEGLCGEADGRGPPH